MKRKIYLNMIANLLLQAVTIINGFILPRLFISTFGSEVNGLVSSLSQFLNYVTLLEGGVSGVIMASLYKPLYEDDKHKISAVIAAANQFFKRISNIFLVYTFLLAIIYPIIVKSAFSFVYIFSLTIILGTNLFIQYNFSLSLKLLLNADNKIYITSILQVITIILNTIGVYVGILVFPDIHIIKIVTAVIYLIQPIGYKYYVNKYYGLEKDVEPDKNAISQRWNGFGINFAYFIHSNTDMVLISTFINLKSVSVYTVHMLVVNGMKAIEGAISGALTPTIGRIIAKGDKKELQDVFEVFEFFLIFLVFFFFTVAGIVIVPFVMLYTNGVNDANYYQPVFAVVMIVAELIYCMRDPYDIVCFQAGHFKQLEKCAMTEAILNIVISLLLIHSMGIIGVGIGTLIAMSYRTIYQVFYIKNNILFRSPKYFFKYLTVFGITAVSTYWILSTILDLSNYSFIGWFVNLVITALFTFLIYILVSFLFFRKNLFNLCRQMLSRR